MTKKLLLFLILFIPGTLIVAQKYQIPMDQLKKEKLYTDIDKALQNPEEVYRFKFDGSTSKDKSIPKGLFTLPNLQELILVNTNIETFPPEILKYNNLQILDLSFNTIRQLPANFGELSSLKELKLQFCGLTSLPESFCSLIHLQKLNLFANHIHSVPSCIKNFRGLKQINLQRNGLSQEEKARMKRQFSKVKFDF